MTGTVETLSLDGEWVLQALNGDAVPDDLRDRLVSGIPALVPGEATIDLLRVGLIEHPFDGDNEERSQWIGDVDWKFTRTFQWKGVEDSRIDLAADGLDTVAAIMLNGRPVAHVENIYRTYRWDIRDFVHVGENEISIIFSSPFREAEMREHRRGFYYHGDKHAYNQFRGSCTRFGWDWGVDVANAGIIKSMRIEMWSDARVDSVRPLASVREDGAGVLDVFVDIERAEHLTTLNRSSAIGISARVLVDGYGFHQEKTVPLGLASTIAHAQLIVPDVRLWWPAGYGEQPLYNVTVELEAADAVPDSVSTAVGSSWSGRVGFRNIRVDTAFDGHGHPFQLYVNDVPIHARGFNWIPDDAFFSQITRANYERRMADLVESNSNMVRVWGGGLYEGEDFYDLADELGITVWQDFMFACAAYPEDAAMRAEVEAEALEQITRLSKHPSVVVWNGSNENYLAYTEWGDFRAASRNDDLPKNRFGYGENGWGDYYYTELLPTLLERLSGAASGSVSGSTRAVYLASSPMSLTPYVSTGIDSDGTEHLWDSWNSADYSRFLEHAPRFADEFGYQAPPAFSTMTRYIHDVLLDPFGKQMLAHQKAYMGNEKLAKGMRSHLTPGHFEDVAIDAEGRRSWLLPTDQWDDIEDWHWACQLQQANAIGFGLAHMRSLEPLNAGALVWQLNDDWPVVSWSAVDYEGHRKPMWYAARDCFAPLFATIQPRVSAAARQRYDWDGNTIPADTVALVIVNDSMHDWSGAWTIERISLDGVRLASQTVRVDVAAHSQVTVTLDNAVACFEDVARELIVATAGLNTAETDADLGSNAGSVNFARVILNGAEVVDQALEPRPFDVIAEKKTDGSGYLLTVTARAYVRELFCMADKVTDCADSATYDVATAVVGVAKGRVICGSVVDSGLVSLLPGESVTLAIASAADVDPGAFTQPRVLRCANDLKR